MKFLQTIEYELFDLSGLFFFFLYKYVSPEGGNHQESTFLRAGHLLALSA